MARLLLDAEQCQGHGRCYSLAPRLFDMDEDGHGIVREEAFDASDLDAAHRSVLECPEGAISVDAGRTDQGAG